MHISGINRIRLEFKESKVKSFITPTSCINRIRLEFKELYDLGGDLSKVRVLIESDWNLKVD